MEETVANTMVHITRGHTPKNSVGKEQGEQNVISTKNYSLPAPIPTPYQEVAHTGHNWHLNAVVFVNSKLHQRKIQSSVVITTEPRGSAKQGVGANPMQRTTGWTQTKYDISRYYDGGFSG